MCWDFQLPLKVSCHHCLIVIVSCHGEQSTRAFLPSFLWPLSLFNERDHPGCSKGISAVSDPLADCLSDGLEDLVVSPVIAPLAQCLGAAAQNVFKGPCIGTQRACRCFYFAPCEQVGWAGVDIVDPLNQKLDPLGVPLLVVLPGYISLHCLFPLHPGTLLSHCHCPACSLFLH